MLTGSVKKEYPPIVFHTYPFCTKTDMPEDMKQEVSELCVTAEEKYYNDNYKIAKMIKENLDKKFGPPFNVVVGESYGFNIVHQEKSLLYMFNNGNHAILVWRTI